jgi:hypothetical protein
VSAGSVEFDQPSGFVEALTLLAGGNTNAKKVAVDALSEVVVGMRFGAQLFNSGENVAIDHHVIFHLEVYGNFLGILGVEVAFV